MNKHHGLYKFVTCDTDEIIYIGKTNNNLKCRVADHIRGKGIDEKFNAFKGNYKIFVAFLPNATETDIMERALINQYKPVLNITDNHKGMSNLITIEEPKWIEFEEAFSKQEIKPTPTMARREISYVEMNDTMVLLKTIYTKDRHGQVAFWNERHEVLCKVEVDLNEYEINYLGLPAWYTFTVFAWDYAGESVLEYRGRTYSIKRTFMSDSNSDHIKLYVSWKKRR